MQIRDFSHKGVVYEVREPSPALLAESQAIADKTLIDAVAAGRPTMHQMQRAAYVTGQWGDWHQRRLDTLSAEAKEISKKLEKTSLSGGVRRRLDEQHKSIQRNWTSLRKRLTKLEERTAEAKALHEQFDHLLLHCSFEKSSGLPLFRSVQEIRSRRKDIVTNRASELLFELAHLKTKPRSNVK